MIAEGVILVEEANPPMVRDPQALFAGGAATAAGLFAGSALYISAVQHPALTQVTTSPSVRAAFFRSMFRRAAPFQASLATLSGAAAVMAGLLQREQHVLSGRNAGSHDKETSLWFATGATMVSIVPFTLLAMMPLNQQLMDMDKGLVERGDAWLDASLKKWGRLHGVRTGASLLAFTGMVAVLTGGLRGPTSKQRL